MLEVELRKVMAHMERDLVDAERQLMQLRRRALRLGFYDIATSCLHGRHMVAGLSCDRVKALYVARLIAKEQPKAVNIKLLALLLEKAGKYRAASNAYKNLLDVLVVGSDDHGRYYDVATEGLRRTQQRLRRAGSDR
ncbi:MAG: hypothetical protein U0359_25245 [Byssovorax sp.]